MIGGGGAGKSHLIRIVSQWTEKILMRQTEPYKAEAYTPKVLLLAYTGSASSLIGNDLYIYIWFFPLYNLYYVNSRGRC